MVKIKTSKRRWGVSPGGPQHEMKASPSRFYHARARKDQLPLLDHFVVHTQPNCETRAFKDLRDQSYAVYFPQIRVVRRHARKVELVPRPFFPRYMFVRDDGRGVSGIKRSRGVNDVVRMGLEPRRVSQSIIDQIRVREDAEGFVVLTEELAAKPFRVGEMLRVNDDDSPFHDLNVVFHQMRGETRAMVFLTNVLQTNNKFKVEIPVRVLERTAA